MTNLRHQAHLRLHVPIDLHGSVEVHRVLAGRHCSRVQHHGLGASGAEGIAVDLERQALLICPPACIYQGGEGVLGRLQEVILQDSTAQVVCRCLPVRQLLV